MSHFRTYQKQINWTLVQISGSSFYHPLENNYVSTNDIEWSCKSDAECTANGSVCKEQQCQCSPGYIFNNDMTACLRGNSIAFIPFLFLFYCINQCFKINNTDIIGIVNLYKSRGDLRWQVRRNNTMFEISFHWWTMHWKCMRMRTRISLPTW